MAYDRFLIAPINSGFQSDLRPFLIPEDAFATLNNAYTFRGRVRKRFGARPMNINVDPLYWQQFTRLRIAIPTANGVTNAAGDAGLVVPFAFVPNGIAPGTSIVAGATMFTVGNDYFIPTDFTPGMHLMATNNLLAVGLYDATTGQYSFANATPLTQIYYYTGLPVMGFIIYEQGQINNNNTIAFDTRYAYIFAGGGWSRLGTAVWTGTDAQFFQGTTWHGTTDYSNILFVTNFNQPDQIKYWNGAAWTTFNPVINAAGNTLETSRILIVFKNRLIALNTIENIGGMQNFFNRARFSQNGSPVQVDSWREDIPGKGGWIDCPVKQSIVTAQILKDRLIVYFESSTWELVYTGNEILPFRWQQINTELGAISTFSEIPFDKVVLGIGNVGVHACNAANVERIDEKIPDQVFDINQFDNGPQRVAGVRDFKTEMVYWSYPSNVAYGTLSPKYPNKILVYNYRNSTWATNDDSITAFGYYNLQDALTWLSNEKWQNVTDLWNSGTMAVHPLQIIAGNQQGFTFLVDIDNSRNALSLQITSINVATGIFTVYNHNFQVNEYVLIENCASMPEIDNKIFQVVPIDANTFTLFGVVIVSAYDAQGTITRISRIDIVTKQFNFYLKQARNAFIAKVDFLVNHDPGGLLTVECFPSYGNIPLQLAAQGNNCNLGTSVLELTSYADIPTELFSQQFWHPIYFQAEGESVQFQISLSHAQISDPVAAVSDFQLNAFVIYTMPTANRLE